MKTCSKCKQTKKEPEFYRNSVRTDGLQSQCKSCCNNNKRTKEHNKKYIKTHREQINLATRKRHRKKKTAWVESKGGACRLCGYNKCVAALEFHHVDPHTKDGGMDRLPIEKIQKELNKCVLLCANCHKEIHFTNE